MFLEYIPSRPHFIWYIQSYILSTKVDKSRNLANPIFLLTKLLTYDDFCSSIYSIGLGQEAYGALAIFYEVIF